MGRPSVKEQRAEEILNAFELCVANYGVEGATLERIAEQAGLARALIRHHVGNRDALLDAMVNRFISTAAVISQGFFEQLPENNRIDALLAGLFDPQYSDSHQMRVISALLIAMHDRPELAKALREWTLDFVATVANELSIAFPKQPKSKVNTVATAVSALYFSADTFTAMEGMETFRSSAQEGAQLLVATLETPQK